MLNLEKLFNNNELYKLANNYKKSCFEALLTFLEGKSYDETNLKSLYNLLIDNFNKYSSCNFSTFFYYIVMKMAYNKSVQFNQEYNFLLLIFAFDSLFLILDNESSFELNCPIEYNILLPTTGINLRLFKNIKSVIKRGDCIVLKMTNNQESVYLTTNKYKILDTISVINLRDDNYVYQDIIKTYASCDLISEINFNTFYLKLREAIFKLNDIDKDFMYNIQNIEVIIPMAFVSDDITKSFTLSGIPHLIFLSDCNSIIKLMENLVHESFHDELNIFMNYYDLALQQDKYYYSPWREDPRPIRGLLHAIYVFTGIFNFYSEFLLGKHQIATDEKEYIVFRYSLIYYELGLAFYQLENDSVELTSLGSYFINSLKSIYNASCTKYLYSHCPSSIIEHLKRWKEANISYKIHIPSQDFFIRGNRQ